MDRLPGDLDRIKKFYFPGSESFFIRTAGRDYQPGCAGGIEPALFRTGFIDITCIIPEKMRAERWNPD
jgi:hypothetical protein